jgi:hypothetical protein
MEQPAGLATIASGRGQPECDAHGNEGFCVQGFVCGLLARKEPVMATATQGRDNGSAKSEGTRKQRPIWSKGFPVKVAVFEFPTENGPPNYSVKITRSFRRDENSDWETSDYLGAQDLLRGSRLLEAADAFIQARLEADYKSRKADQPVGDSDVQF